LSSVLTGTKEL
jgi:hypothetical protein